VDFAGSRNGAESHNQVTQVVSRLMVAVLMAASLVALVVVSAPKAKAADLCSAPTNPVLCENSKPGTPESTWDISGQGDTSIQGFATEMSVNAGSTESFKVRTSAPYTIDIYRLGYYGGDGARLITSLTPTARTQPTCLTQDSTHLIDCGNWQVSASWAVPATAVSGMYIAKLTRTDTQGDSHIPFIVRSDSSTSGILFQASDTTWQAYNNWGGDQFYNGGANLYGGTSYTQNNRAYKVSYNRPFQSRSWEGGRDYLFSNEYPMIRFLESNGYDVSYISGIDSARNGAVLKQHKVLLTAGHDEYWSGTQRANITAARDAGVNLAFFAGNDNYWKTRYENSMDSSTTAYRTLVTYKETWAGNKIDPSPEWTGTWRDPRFSPPADGGNPENALGGTLFMSNITDLPVTVNQAEGKLRIWRNTSLASLGTGASAQLAPHTVGYESNEDLDNGFRPAGLIDMSTSTGSVTAELKDFGSTTGAGTTTHHITLYQAPSGALVFSAGTVQWAWGLDSDHDGVQSPADPRMQQATVNLLADMGVQPLSLISGLVAATKTTDATAPTSVITSPAAGATIANGAQVTVTGTATDAGGQVGGVEVSVDGGSSWHPATGRGTWTYSFVAHGSGSVAIKSRATDDSGNIETPGAGRTVTMNCPCSLFGTATPATTDSGDTGDVELGVKFAPTGNGSISGVRFYKSTGNTGTHVGTLWSSGGTALATGTFSGETASGWQTLTFSNPVAVTTGTTYVASYRAPRGHYAADPYYFSVSDQVAGPLRALRSTVTSGNGVYANGGQFPASTYQDENYYVDAVFAGADTTPPSITAITPRSLQKGVAVSGSTVTATFAAPITSGSAQVVLKNSAGTSVPGSTAYNSVTQTVTFTPGSALATSTTYTATVSGATTPSGTAMTPVSWSFTTDTVASCPCSLFGTPSTPTTVDSGDTGSVEVGTRFIPSTGGVVTGVRFYKAAANTGTHTGTLWSSSGTALATGTFGAETASGWQTLTFGSPVPVTAGTTYIASYLAPSGHYSADGSFFTASYTSGSLTAPSNTNGVYVYGLGGTAPTNTFGSSNYWVDPLFLPGSTAPTVTSTTPANAATGVGVGTSVSATFSVPVQSASVTFTLTGPGSTSVAGTVAVSGSAATFTPTAALSASTTYTAQVSGAQNSSGTPMAAPVSWTFTTATAATCPCSLFAASTTPATPDSGDPAAVQIGVRVTPTVSGFITGVKFYKATTNTGTHTGTLWSSSGTVLATGTFTSESASGWQTLTFPTAVAVTAGTTYTASYRAPNGHYSATSNYFASAYTNGPLVAPSTGGNGVYVYGTGSSAPTNTYQASNYWVDVTFVTSSSAPTVASTTPAAGATGVAVSTAPTAQFSLPVQSSSVQFTLTTTTGQNAVTGTVTYASGTAIATFTPAAALAASTQYTATVSATSSSGTPMASPTSWNFTTAAAATCPCSLFGSSSTPAVVDSGETSSLEVGVRFTPSRNGTVTGVKFYKAAANTGTHTGSLWSASGTRLATGTFTNETASGWQTLTFSTPVTVTAATTYTASYYTPSGHFSMTRNAFGADIVNGPLTAPAAGGNGVYLYGTGGSIPTNSYQATNYWVDVNFT
jgi:Domain of unknown function (DUF4082)/Bacterial Ig-like domain/Bacterial Ig domain